MGRKFLLAVLAAALFAPGVFAQADLSATVPYRNMITDFTVVKKETAALLVIDAQNDLASPNNAAVSASIAQAVGMFRKAGRPIIHVVRLYDAAGSNADLFIRTQLQNGLKFLQPGMPGSEFIPGTVPPGTKLNFDILMRGGVQTISDIEFAIYKPRLNPFTRTNLDQFLKSQNTNAVFLTGFSGTNDVRAAQIGANDLDYRVALIPEACADSFPQLLATYQSEGVQLMTLEDTGKLLGLAPEPKPAETAAPATPAPAPAAPAKTKSAPKAKKAKTVTQ